MAGSGVRSFTSQLRAVSRYVLLDCHTFPSRALPHVPDQDPGRLEICLATEKYRTPAEFR